MFGVANFGNETPGYKCSFNMMKMQMVSVCMSGAKQEKDVSLFEKKCKAHNADEDNDRKNPEVLGSAGIF